MPCNIVSILYGFLIFETVPNNSISSNNYYNYTLSLNKDYTCSLSVYKPYDCTKDVLLREYKENVKITHKCSSRSFSRFRSNTTA